MVLVIVSLKAGLEMDYAMERIRPGALIFAAMILTVAIVPKQNVVILSVVMVSVMVMRLKNLVQMIVLRVKHAMSVNLISQLTVLNAAILHGMSLV
jgi:hypothetical protein